ncbi:MAG TPA: protein kinase [Polyangia bacterium]
MPETEQVDAQLVQARHLASQGERAAARSLLEQLERADGEAGAKACALLASLDEEEGLLHRAAERWERRLADNIEDPEAKARLTLLRQRLAAPLPPRPLDPTQTLVEPEGVSLSRYEVVRAIGRGATSTVYLARDHLLGIELALKVFHPPSRLTEACQRFFAEARLVAALRHPGVVAIIDLDEATRTLVMEHLPGGSLRERLGAMRPAALPFDEVASLARALLNTLGYVHTAGIVHGDITPRNILFRSPREPVLADFGSARLLGGEGDYELAAGTPIYLAPEQLHGEASSPRTDLFAVGAILWEALAGRPMRQHADLLSGHAQSPLLPHHPTEESPGRSRLVTLVSGLTENDPQKRVNNAAQALETLEA